MPNEFQPQLARVVGLPLIVIGVLAAVLVWELEHVGSVALIVLIAAAMIGGAAAVAWRARRRIDRLSAHYKSLLDITDEQSKKAEAANRLKDDFLATLSHELRTPLNSVLGWARLLASGKLDARQTRRAIDAIERAGCAQSRLIEDLLDISRIVAGKLELTPSPTRLQPLVVSAIHALQPAADAKRITVSSDLDAAIGPIAVDPDRFQQVAWNLISNAIKFTPSGGAVSVVLTGDGQRVRLSVSDSGVGFDPDVAAHLFERFRQADSSTTREYGGLGLGLGIVRHLVELHGGTVTAESPGRNRGAVFTVTVPVVVSAEAAPHVAAVPRSGMLRGISVLAVDDDPLALDFVQAALEEYGASVRRARSAADARARFDESAPDVIVCDLAMPHEDGIALIRSIRERDERRGRRTPAAALSGLARREDRQLALAAGYQMHVTKPIDPNELALAVERLARLDRADEDVPNRSPADAA